MVAFDQNKNAKKFWVFFLFLLAVPMMGDYSKKEAMSTN